MHVKTLRAAAKWAMAFGLCMSCSFGFAQRDDRIEFTETKASLACMLPAEAERGTPTYPPNARDGQLSATVKVKLPFLAPNAEPKVEILSRANSEFDESVWQYVRRYRLPCLVPGQVPIEAQQQFHFEYGDGRKVVFSSLDGSARNAYEGCVASARPSYPASVGQSGEGGNVILKMKFSQRGKPPDVEVIYGGRNKWLKESAIEAVNKLTSNCDIPEGAPLVAMQKFIFRVEGGQAFDLRDVNLMEFLHSVDRKEFGKVRFDFKTMGCPFDLNVVLYRPYMPNKVGEFEKSDPSRRDFIEWLSLLTMQFPKGTEQYLIGKSLKLSVPCLVLDFT